jgi:ferritin-like metal-binding protein YciE
MNLRNFIDTVHDFRAAERDLTEAVLLAAAIEPDYERGGSGDHGDPTAEAVFELDALHDEIRIARKVIRKATKEMNDQAQALNTEMERYFRS